MLKGKYSNIVYQDKDFIFCEKKVNFSKGYRNWNSKGSNKKIFFLLNKSKGNLEAYGGTGLGLSITKGLVEALNGKVNVKSKIMEEARSKYFNNIEEFQYSNKEDGGFIK